ncbi:hypothetical protein ABT354_09065 [Streptomyces sp. NPDC000594]|uniref:hypothetical protein n=1 Tax=Streptomyces sp. NPDC000594 TaxID=3154261 RepID=UPI00332D4920
MLLSDWASGLIDRVVDAADREEMRARFADLDEAVFHREDPNRMVSAIVLNRLQGHSMKLIFEEVRWDYRDTLWGSGVDDRDWREVMNERFGYAPPE